MKIRIVNIYIGKCPNYFDLFLMSCAKNPSIDFLFFIDFDAPFDVPSNVQFIRTTLYDITAQFQAKFDFEISLRYAYKLCDFRPAYGEIFASYFDGYDWWGHCDFDMIFGDLSPVIELACQSKYVKIFRQGHLTLYRNDEAINQVYRGDDISASRASTRNDEAINQAYPNDGLFINYRDVFSTDKFYSFCEYWGIDKMFSLMNLPVYREDMLADISPNSAFLKMTEHPNHWGQYFVWDGGKIVRKRLSLMNGDGDEYIYMHLQKRKIVKHFDAIDSKSAVILINQFGLFDCTTWPRVSWIFAVSSYVPNIAHLYRFYFLRKLKKIKQVLNRAL